jgi:hypothetical protein
MRGKYLNVFGERAEGIYASMEKTQKGSWRILLLLDPTVGGWTLKSGKRDKLAETLKKMNHEIIKSE